MELFVIMNEENYINSNDNKSNYFINKKFGEKMWKNV